MCADDACVSLRELEHYFHFFRRRRLDDVFGILPSAMRFDLQLQVFRPIVGADAVFVVDVFPALKRSPKMLLHDKAVDFCRTSVDANPHITAVRRIVL